MIQSELNSAQKAVYDRLPIIVDDQGNAETENSRMKHPVIHREQIAPENTSARIDLDRLTQSTGEDAAYILLLDFGLPIRTITIDKVRTTGTYDSTVTDSEEGFEEKDQVLISCRSRGWAGRTETYIDGEDFDEGDITLVSGQHVFFAHDGDPFDFRTGFIMNYAQIAAFKGDRWADVETVRRVKEFTPIIRIGYEGNSIVIEAYDDTNAELIYETLVSDANGGETPRAQRTREQVLEVALARSKQHVTDLQGELQEAILEIKKLKEKGQATRPQRTSDASPTERTSSQDPDGYCKILGLDPEQLFSKPPKEAKRIVAGMRRVLATLYHEDVNPGGDKQLLSKINDAADKVLARITSGSWSKR